MRDGMKGWRRKGPVGRQPKEMGGIYSRIGRWGDGNHLPMLRLCSRSRMQAVQPDPAKQSRSRYQRETFELAQPQHHFPIPSRCHCRHRVVSNCLEQAAFVCPASAQTAGGEQPSGMHGLPDKMRNPARRQGVDPGAPTVENAYSVSQPEAGRQRGPVNRANIHLARSETL